MASSVVTFLFMTGIKKQIFKNARLQGSWDDQGLYASEWSSTVMEPVIGDDGCPAFVASITFPEEQAGQVFKWGVLIDGPGGNNLWGIVTEVAKGDDAERYRTFQLNKPEQEERFYYTYCRRLGANKMYIGGNDEAKLRFAVWAPSAQSVSVVFGHRKGGYIDNDGKGRDLKKPVIELHKEEDGIWGNMPVLSFAEYSGQPYMYRIQNAEGKTVYRTDIFSKSQIGSGNIDPSLADSNWPGTVSTLNGSKSCSVIIDPDIIRSDFEHPKAGEARFISAEEFWKNEYDVNKPVPMRVDDLVIYELHIGSLGYGKDSLGTLTDAIAMLDYFEDLGINAIELLPMADFSGSVGWGYGDTHHQVIQTAAGGRDQYRHFIRACHQRGIAVIQDVVYNHYDGDAERAQWQYDGVLPEQNCFYWYEGSPEDYSFPEGGYIDNGSSGWAPNYRAEVVRQQFISSAVFLMEEMHVDGFRVDLTQAIHRDNVLHANGAAVNEANLFGQKLLREWSRSLKIIRPSVMLIAEDHTGWDAVTKLPADGGLGFDATWFVNFYHSLIGDSDSAGANARLLKRAGYGTNEPLAMDNFASQLNTSQFKKIVYHESHDEAGNAADSARTICVAVNNAVLLGDNRVWAEKRARVVFGLSLLSAGTPMFLMGEEVGAQKLYKYDDFQNNREDLQGQRKGNGAHMFRFYQDAIKLSRQLYAVRSHNIDLLHANNENRVIAFKRFMDTEQLLIVASLNNTPFDQYTIANDVYRLPDGLWKEIFNSDARVYGGANTGNEGASLPSVNGTLKLRLPANGFIVLIKE